MWSILANLAAGCLGWYTKSPLAKEIVSTVVQDLKDEGARVLPIAIDAIKSVASDDSLTGRGKFDYVAATIAAQVDDVGASVANSLINVAYRALKEDPDVPEVQQGQSHD